MKPTLRSFFSIAPALREHLGRGVEREELRDRGQRGRGADRFEERAPRGILGKHRAHHRGGDHALVALVLASLSTGAHCSCELRVAFMLDLAGMAAAGTARRAQPALRIEGIVEHGHRRAPSLTPRPARRGVNELAMGVPKQRLSTAGYWRSIFAGNCMQAGPKAACAWASALNFIVLPKKQAAADRSRRQNFRSPLPPELSSARPRRGRR